MTKNIEKNNIDLGGTYAENVLSAYIWKALSPPEANQIVNYDFNKPIPTIEIVSKDYMNYIGNNVQLAQQKLIQVFFNRSKLYRFI